MDLSLLPAPDRECNKQTGVRFTVRSASSPSYSLSHRQGVRKPGGFSEEEREVAEDAGEQKTNGTIKEENGVPKYPALTCGSSSVKDQEILGRKMSPKLNQNGTGDRTIKESGTDKSQNFTFVSQARKETRRYNLSSRSKSLDCRMEERSPVVRDAAANVWSSKGAGINIPTGSSDESQRGAEAVMGKVTPSITAYKSAGNDVQEGNPRSPLSPTMDRVSRGHSLPSRMRSLAGPGSRFNDTAASLGHKGGQSIMERIEKLYGSAGFGRAEDGGKVYPDSLVSPQPRSYERAAGGTFPRRFSAGERNTFTPMQSTKSVTWSPQKDTSGSEGSVSLARSRRLSGGLWSGHVQGRVAEEDGGNWGKVSVEVGTRSLDRARSRNTIAAQIRSARAAGDVAAAPNSNGLLKDATSQGPKDSARLKARGSVDQGIANHREEQGEATGINGAKERSEVKSAGTDEDVFGSNPNKTTLNNMQMKNLPAASSAASVRNKINQFEALSQRAQSLATGQGSLPRRAFSVPTQLSRGHDGVTKSGSAKAIGGLRDKWEGRKLGGEDHDESEEKGVRVRKKHPLDRFFSVDGAGTGRTDREGSDPDVRERKETEHFGQYSTLKGTLEIPLNGGAQRRQRTFHIDETDFSKATSPEEASARAAASPPEPRNSDTSPGGREITSPGITSPVGDDDDDNTPTNTPNQSPFLSPTTQPELTAPLADECDGFFTRAGATSDPDSPPPPPGPLATSSHSKLPDLISPQDNAARQKGKKQALDLDAWVAGLNSAIKVWNDNEDDDDGDTQKDDDSNYDSDSGESSVTITSNMSQSDGRSFSLSLSDLCNFAGVDYESENDSDEWQPRGRRSASLSSDVSALSYVSVMPSEELDRLLEDVRSLGDNTLREYDGVQVVVLHKEVGVGLGFSVAGGVDQSKPVTVHRVFHSGVAAQEGSIREGDQVLSINGTALCGHAHWEVLRVLRRAKTREMGVVVLRRGDVSGVLKSTEQTSMEGTTQTQVTVAGQDMCVRLEKNSRDLGFSLEGGVGSSLGNRPLTVQKIFQGGPVDIVYPGDVVLQIEGVSLVGMRRLEAWTLIRKLPSGPVDVILRRPQKHLET